MQIALIFTTPSGWAAYSSGWPDLRGQLCEPGQISRTLSGAAVSPKYAAAANT